MLYTAKCYWPGVAPTELAMLAARAEQATLTASAKVAYLGSLWFVDDDLVLCLFDGQSRAEVQRTTEHARIPCERVMASAWLNPTATLPSNPPATPPTGDRPDR